MKTEMMIGNYQESC